MGWRNTIATEIFQLPPRRWEARHRRLSLHALLLLSPLCAQRRAERSSVQVQPDADRRFTVSDFCPAAALGLLRRRELKDPCIEMYLSEDNTRGDEVCARVCVCVYERRWFMSSRQTDCCNNSSGLMEVETDNSPDKDFSSGWSFSAQFVELSSLFFLSIRSLVEACALYAHVSSTPPPPSLSLTHTQSPHQS